MRASTSISISLTFCNWSGVSTARMSCETWARCTARSDSSEATFAACARMAVSSMVAAWMVSRKARRSVTTCLISGPTVGWYLRRMVFTSAFWSAVTPSCFSLRPKRPLLKPTSLVVSACARNAKKPPTVAAATAPAAINAFVCVFIFLYPFHQYKTRHGQGRLHEGNRIRRIDPLAVVLVFGSGLGARLMLQAQLAAGGVDVGAFFQAQGAGDAVRLQRVLEHLAAVAIGALQEKALDGVAGDEIDLGAQAPGSGAELMRLFEGIVYAFDENVLEGQHAFLRVYVVVAGVEEFLQRVLLIHRHDLFTNLIGCAMQRDGEAELHRFVGEFCDLRHETDGGHGDLARADAETPRGVDDP